MSTTLGTIRHLLTSAEAARTLGVGVSSVKRWTGEGRLRAVRTPGGHRRYEAEEIERFRIVLGREDGEEAPPLAPVAIAEDATADRRHRAATLDALGDELRELGDKWARGEIGIDEEHAFTHRVSEDLDALRTMNADGPLALLACPPGEQHELPLRMVRLMLEWRGWRTEMLGANLPWDALQHAVSRLHPKLVALTSRHAIDAPELRKIAKKTRVVVGGSWARGPGKGVLRFRSLRAFDRWLGSLD